MSSSWAQYGGDIIRYLDETGGPGAFLMGFSVRYSLDGTVLAVGAPAYNSGGGVFIYSLVNDQWTQKGNYILPNNSLIDSALEFGKVVDLNNDGTIVAINCPSGYDPVQQTLGVVVVYQYNVGNNTWELYGNAIYTQPGAENVYDIALSGDGNTLVISGNETRVVRYSSGSWVLDVTLPGASICALSKDGNTIVLNDGPDANIYKYATSWSLVKTIINPSNVLNMEMNNDGSIILLANAVSVQAYEYSGGDYVSMGSSFNIKPNNGIAMTNDGTYMAFSDDTLPNNMLIYKYVNTDWVQIGASISDFGTDYRDRPSISLEKNGNDLLLAVGSPSYEEYYAPEDITDLFGRVRTFRYTDSGTVKVLPTLSVTSETVSKLKTSPEFSVGFVTNSDGAISYVSSETSIATVDASGTVTLTGVVGSTIITITQAEGTEHLAGESSLTVTINVIETPTLAPTVTINSTPTEVNISINPNTGVNTTISSVYLELVNILGVDVSDNVPANLTVTNNGQTETVLAKLRINAFDNNNNSLTDFTNAPITLSMDLPSINTSGTLYVYKLDDQTGNILDHPSYPVQMTYNSNTEKWTANLPTLSEFVITQTLIGNICFLAGTLIETTHHGKVPIEKLNKSIHTIRGKPIVGITQTTYINDRCLIAFEKDALGKNVPSEQTVMSENHQVFYKGKMVRAKHFVGHFEGVKQVEYKGEILYNVLMEKHDRVVVNNMICETLHPEHNVAKMHVALSNMSNLERIQCVKWFNQNTRSANKTKPTTSHLL